MCGRFTLTTNDYESVARAIGAQLDGPHASDFRARYNIAPSDRHWIVCIDGMADPDARVISPAVWGLPAPPGSRSDPSIAHINARSETAATKNSFRAAMRHRRVLIPASGFFEWKRQEGRKSQAYFIRPREGGTVAFAGLMETWAEPGGSEIDTAAILTTAANHTIGHIHDRMPVIIGQDDFSRWLDCSGQSPADVAELLRPAPDTLMEAVPISDRVNKVANSDPGILEPVRVEEPKSDPAVTSDKNGQLPLL